MREVPAPELGSWVSVEEAAIRVYFRGLAEERGEKVEAMFSNRAHCAALIELKVSCDYLEESEQGFARSVVVALLQSLSDTLLFALNLASPDAVAFGASHWYVDDSSEPEVQDSLEPQLYGVREYIERTGWPRLVQVPAGTALFWVLLNAWQARAGDSPVSRAYNAYTHLFGSGASSESFRLLIAMVGIEALFNNGPGTAGTQLRNRIELLLGKREGFTRDLSEMYTQRSKVIHGSARIMPLRPPWEPPTEARRRLRALEESGGLAVSILLISLQTLATRNWSSLTFSESLEGAFQEIPEPQQDFLGNEFLRVNSDVLMELLPEMFIGELVPDQTDEK